MPLQAIKTEHPAIHINRTFNVSPARMFEAWTQPGELSRWFGPEGVTVEEASVDLRVGGIMTLTLNLPDGKQTILKTVYKEIVDGQRLVFTWQWVDPGCEGSKEVEGETLVTVDFKPAGDNKTEVSILHEGLPTESARGHHTEGWNGCLDSLTTELG